MVCKMLFGLGFGGRWREKAGWSGRRDWCCWLGWAGGLGWAAGLGWGVLGCGCPWAFRPLTQEWPQCCPGPPPNLGPPASGQLGNPCACLLLLVLLLLLAVLLLCSFILQPKLKDTESNADKKKNSRQDRQQQHYEFWLPLGVAACLAVRKKGKQGRQQLYRRRVGQHFGR